MSYLLFDTHQIQFTARWEFCRDLCWFDSVYSWANHWKKFHNTLLFTLHLSVRLHQIVGHVGGVNIPQINVIKKIMLPKISSAKWANHTMNWTYSSTTKRHAFYRVLTNTCTRSCRWIYTNLIYISTIKYIQESIKVQNIQLKCFYYPFCID